MSPLLLWPLSQEASQKVSHHCLIKSWGLSGVKHLTKASDKFLSAGWWGYCISRSQVPEPQKPGPQDDRSKNIFISVVLFRSSQRLCLGLLCVRLWETLKISSIASGGGELTIKNSEIKGVGWPEWCESDAEEGLF